MATLNSNYLPAQVAWLLILLLPLSSAAVTKNGFDLHDALIPATEIFQGGPPRDGIPAIDRPKFISADKADFLAPDDRVVGIEIEGEARAYPIKILNWHEIVNDSIKSKPITVTFCPLCGTAIVFSAKVKNLSRQFAVSGLLYNNDVLLYDRESESLWSQIRMQAISGSLKGQKLESLPSNHTSWKDWRRRFPNTLVLSTKTGHKRNYNRSPYTGYEKGKEIYFPLTLRSERYHPKERVLGTTVNGINKAYPFVELAKSNQSTIQDKVGGKTLQIKFDIENRDGSVTSDGITLPSINSYWFAWYAFHSDTVVYKYQE